MPGAVPCQPAWGGEEGGEEGREEGGEGDGDEGGEEGGAGGLMLQAGPFIFPLCL